jgi:hypothetical protein
MSAFSCIIVKFDSNNFAIFLGQGVTVNVRKERERIQKLAVSLVINKCIF